MKIEDVYFLERSFPLNVFKQKFDQYFFMADHLIRCSGENEVFAERLVVFLRSLQALKVEGACLKQLHCNSFTIYADSTAQAYIKAVTFYDDVHRLPINTDCFFGFGIYDTGGKFAIYSEGVLEIGVLGVMNSDMHRVLPAFGDLVLNPQELYETMKLAYHSKRYSKLEHDYKMLLANYGY